MRNTKPSVTQANKIALAEELVSMYNSVEFVFLLTYKGLCAEDNYELRKALKAKGANMRVVKNTINSFAFAKTKFAGLSEFLKDQVAVVVANDPISVAKILCEYQASEKIIPLAYSDGDAVYDDASLKSLSKMPSLEVLRAQLLGTLLSGPQSLVRILCESQSSLVRVLNSHSEKNV